MWRGSLVIRPGTVDVEVLEPISTTGWKVSELDQRVAGVRELFVRAIEEWRV